MKTLLICLVGFVMMSFIPNFTNCVFKQVEAKVESQVSSYSFERIGNHYLFFKETGSIVNELYIVQLDTPTNFEFGTINEVSFSPTLKTTTINTPAGLWFFKINANLNVQNEFQVYGLSRMVYSGQDMSKGTLLNNLQKSGLANGGKDCKKQCLSGGCNSTSCSRSIDVAGSGTSCEVSCINNTHACCGDLVKDGCWCRSNICCNSTGPTH